MVSYFTKHGEKLHAEEFAVSPWQPNHLGGHGVCGLLARELERHCPEDAIPARLTVDLFRPVINCGLEVTSEIVRQGSRVTVADARIDQEDSTRVRGRAVFLKPSVDPHGHVWSRSNDLPLPPEGHMLPEGSPSLYKSGDGEWTKDLSSNQNSERKISWHSLPPLVAGEQITPFQRAAILGDITNHVCHWGSEGVAYINTDMTLAMARLPTGFEVGMRAENTIASEGVSIGTATLYDRGGVFGSCTIAAISNGTKAIDYKDTTRN